jgi:peptidylprolyl isomerase
MKYAALILMLATTTVAANAQTHAKPAAHAAKPATTAAKAVATTNALPPGVPVVAGEHKTMFCLRYQEIAIGTGAEAEPNKIYKVLYTGWLGANGRVDDGRKFDSTDDHPRQPVLDKDGKPVLGEDGKPKQGAPEPIRFPQGFGRVIPGFDQGFTGMKIGGKRRIFIPWQLAYGAKGRPGPDAANPGIPEKADLIFDVELVGVSELEMPPGHPGMMPGMHPMPGGAAPHPGAPAAPNAPATPAAPAAPNAPAAPPAPATPATPAAPVQPQSK